MTAGRRHRWLVVLGVVAVLLLLVVVWFPFDEPEGSVESTAKGERLSVHSLSSPSEQVRANLQPLQPMLELEGIVAGVVRGPAGRGLSEADVCVWPGEKEAVPYRHQATGSCTRTDAVGRFRIENLPRMQFRLAASAPGYAPEVVPREGAPLATTVPGQVVQVDVHLLEEGVLVQGRVLDASGGPVAGAWVRLHEPT